MVAIMDNYLRDSIGIVLWRALHECLSPFSTIHKKLYLSLLCVILKFQDGFS